MSLLFCYRVGTLIASNYVHIRLRCIPNRLLNTSSKMSLRVCYIVLGLKYPQIMFISKINYNNLFSQSLMTSKMSLNAISKSISTWIDETDDTFR